MARGVFIAGTDTGVGKTWASVAIMSALKAAGHRVAGMKPVASGAEWQDGKLFNEDALLIQRACSQSTPYELINPFVYEQPVAPVIAAAGSGNQPDITRLKECYQALAAENDFVVVEGVGGWRVSLSPDISTVDLVRAFSLPVIIVVGLRLGCINHALLTEEAIRADKVKTMGWIANELESDMLQQQQVEELLKTGLNSPCLFKLSHSQALQDLSMDVPNNLPSLLVSPDGLI